MNVPRPQSRRGGSGGGEAGKWRPLSGGVSVEMWTLGLNLLRVFFYLRCVSPPPLPVHGQRVTVAVDGTRSGTMEMINRDKSSLLGLKRLPRGLHQ